MKENGVMTAYDALALHAFKNGTLSYLVTSE